jgi:serine/threonine protein kinase
VPVYEVGEFQGRPFFAMAYIEGKSLQELIKEGKLRVAEAIDLTMQICEGLSEAHNTGVVHRDIKPGNIIIDRKNKARLLDFGLATVTGEKKLTKTGSTLGTVGYMSPEQVKGEGADHRSDLFSVGVLLYEMITGRLPFEAEHDAAVYYNIVNEVPEPLARYKSGVTGELQQIIYKALAKDPSLRYQHVDEMLAQDPPREEEFDFDQRTEWDDDTGV